MAKETFVKSAQKDIYERGKNVESIAVRRHSKNYKLLRFVRRLQQYHVSGSTVKIVK